LIEEIWDSALDGILKLEPQLVLVAYWSQACEPCRRLRPELEELARNSAGVCRVLGIDAEREPDSAARRGIRALPTLIFFRSGLELARFRGGALPPAAAALLARS